MATERRRLAVYCASRLGERPAFAAAATAVGAQLALRDADLVYGGAHVGLMGRVADAAVAGGSHVIGVITEALTDREIAHEGIHDLRQVMDMPARKRVMYDEADAFLALPGGVGTMEELFEILCWAYLGLHDKPVGLLNVEGYYDHLLTFLEGSVADGLCKPRVLGLLAVDTDPARLVDRLLGFGSPHGTDPGGDDTDPGGDDADPGGDDADPGGDGGGRRGGERGGPAIGGNIG